MNDSNKFIRLAGLLLAGFIAFILLLIGIFFILKFSSATLALLPGFDGLFQLLVTTAPYLFFFAGYWYMLSKVKACPKKSLAITGSIIMVIGLLLAIGCLGMKVAFLWISKNQWLTLFDRYSHYGFIAQILLLFSIAMILASGDPKEKNWMEKEPA